MSYDQKCYELAKHFLHGRGTNEQQIYELAQGIQGYIEAWLKWIIPPQSPSQRQSTLAAERKSFP